MYSVALAPAARPAPPALGSPVARARHRIGAPCPASCVAAQGLAFGTFLSIGDCLVTAGERLAADAVSRFLWDTFVHEGHLSPDNRALSSSKNPLHPAQIIAILLGNEAAAMEKLRFLR
ncbi:hypothetical protein ACJJTC_011384 [Scirpophaga incertulas]